MIERAPLVASVVLVGSVACSVESSESPALHAGTDEMMTTPSPPLPAGFTPAWREGDEWLVRYRIGRPAPAPPHRPRVVDPPFVVTQADWEYRVVSVGVDGRARITATHHTQSRDIREHYLFDRHGQLIEFDARESFGFIESEAGPYFPLDREADSDIAREWPKFPLVEGEHELGWGLVQRVLVRRDHSVEVTMINEGRFGPELQEEEVGFMPELSQFGRRTMRQVWESGHPWWSSLVIRLEWFVRPRGKGYKSRNEIEVDARMLSWRPGGRRVE